MQDAIRELGYDKFNHPLWTAKYLVDAPHVIKDAHKRYFEAGAQIVITSSYKTTLPLLKEYLEVGDEQAFNIMQMTTELAIQARDEVLKEERASG